MGPRPPICEVGEQYLLSGVQVTLQGKGVTHTAGRGVITVMIMTFLRTRDAAGCSGIPDTNVILVLSF